MSDSPTWREATSQEEFIHDITEGVIQEFEEDEDFIEIFEGTEYDGVSDFYDQEK